MQGIPQINQGQVNPSISAVSPAITPLILGEVVRGEVLSLLPNAVSMRVKKEIIVAKTDFPLQEGASYLLRVEAFSAKEVRLKIIQSLTETTETEPETALKALNQKGTPLTHYEIIALREKILQEMPPSARQPFPALAALEKLFQKAPSTAGNEFKTAIDSTGNFFEIKLREILLNQAGLEEGGKTAESEKAIAKIIQEDMKGALLKLKEDLQNNLSLLKEKPLHIGEVTSAVDQLLSHIEQQQIQSKLNTVFQTFLPFVWKELKDGKLVFKESYHPQEKGEGYSCTIHLDLEKAGQLVAHLRLLGETLQLGFVTENNRFRELIEAGRPALEEQITAVGLVCNSITVTREKQIDLKMAEGESELDITV
jgi:hypothetical protein